MLLVKTELKPSPIHGLGLFAAEQIKKGELVWELDRNFDRLISEKDFSFIPPIAQQHLDMYGGLWHGNYCVFGDHAKFINHSETPNLRDDLENDRTYALRDIEIGEELTENYRTWFEGDEKYYDEWFSGKSTCFNFLKK